MHSPVQRKYAAEAAHGARGEQGKINLPRPIEMEWDHIRRGELG